MSPDDNRFIDSFDGAMRLDPVEAVQAAPSGHFQRIRVICACFVGASIIVNLGAAIALNHYLPRDFPSGGPDEARHLSVAKYIAEHLRWPPWNAEQLERYGNGASYATSSSLGYWIEGLLLRTLGRPRLSPLLLFAGYLAVLLLCCRRNLTAALFGLAAVTPQFLFVFSYFNSDTWTALVALFLGFTVSRFYRRPDEPRNIVLLFAAAGACITCRFHMWPIGFVAMAYALAPKLRYLLSERRGPLIAGLLVGAIVACWWPVTSYFANDGDLTGFAASRRSVETFGDPNGPILARRFSEINLLQFLTTTATSFYGVWGWANRALGWGYYVVAALIGLPLLARFWWRRPKLLPLHVVLLILNITLMLVYSVQYDYQPQGRYLFPWYFLSVGLVLDDLCSELQTSERRTANWTVLLALIGFSTFNGLAEFQLWKTIERAEQADPVATGYLLLNHGQVDAAVLEFRRALQRDITNPRALNGLGLAMWKKQDLQQAEAFFQSAIRQSPDDFRSRMNLGDLLMKRQRYAEAIQNYEVLEQNDPRSAVVQSRLATANDKLGDREQALSHCRKALEIAPPDWPMRRQFEALERKLTKTKVEKR